MPKHGGPTSAPAVLYLHPRGHLNDLVVPAGALSCLNALDVPKLGRYAFELSDAELRRAALVALDFHWAVSLPGMERLLEHVRRVRPDVPIVAGGISAGHYAEQLTRSGAVDYAIRGDSEEAFASLARAILGGRDAEAIGNVVTRDRAAPPVKRMSVAAFDATDPVRADWFPSYERFRTWDARAFPAGPTVPVARGCPMRCPACYGSFAETFGEGWLLRSPASTVSLVARAEALGARNLRLILGKPGEATVSALASALAEAGPFRFDGDVGFYLCTAPAAAAIEALLAAFSGRVVVSAVAPQEHVPALGPARLALEMDAWRDVVRRARASRGRLRLDLWAGTRSLRDELRATLGEEGPSLGVSLSAVWHLTRPIDGALPPLAHLRGAVAPLWTFYAARLLSPALAEILEPFGLLDELSADPEECETSPPGRVAAWRAVVAAHWRRHRLPLLPGLAWSAVPVVLDGRRAGRHPTDVRFCGAVRYAGPAAATLLAASATPLAERHDHSAVRLRTTTPLPRADGYALVPHDPGGGPPDAAWLADLASRGLVVVPAPAPASDGLALQVTLRVQEAEVALLDGSGVPRCRGRAHLDYVRPPPRGPARDSGGSR